jgi:hypothetical protein
MRQLLPAICIKSAVTGVMLLLLQTIAFAQSEEVDTIETITTIDTSVTSTLYPDEETPVQVESLPDTPVFRAVPDTIVREMQQRKEFAYANDPDYWRRPKITNSDSELSWFDKMIMSKWFRNLILMLMIGVLLYAFIKIAVSNKLFLFRSSSKKSADTEEQQLLEQDNLPQLIQEAEAQSSFRHAVRYRYMKTLQDMDKRSLIRLNAQSTNWDYVNAMNAHPLKKQFLLLTRAYEYVWYGEFDVNAEQYGYLKTEFQQFESSI